MNIDIFDGFTFYPRERLDELFIPEEYSEFLTRTGLPTWCAPEMHFGKVGEAWTFLPVIEVGPERYVGLGEDRDDAVIGLNLKEHSIWVITEDSEPAFMAQSVTELSQALYRFQACIDSAVESDATAFTENRIPPPCLEPFVFWANTTNRFLVQDGSFWHSVLLWLGVPNQSFKADA